MFAVLRTIEGFDLSHFGSAPTKFDENDLFPLTAHYLQSLPTGSVKSDLDALGVPVDLQEPFWTVARDNITTRHDLEKWWTLCAQGAEPLIDDEDKDFVAEALALLPAAPFTDTSWKDWTGAVKDATGRKGRGLFMPLRKALTGMEHGPDMGSLMPLLQNIKRG
jgi:glutamyl-tRNA synthetase